MDILVLQSTTTTLGISASHFIICLFYRRVCQTNSMRGVLNRSYVVVGKLHGIEYGPHDFTEESFIGGTPEWCQWPENCIGRHGRDISIDLWRGSKDLSHETTYLTMAPFTFNIVHIWRTSRSDLLFASDIFSTVFLKSFVSSGQIHMG